MILLVGIIKKDIILPINVRLQGSKATKIRTKMMMNQQMEQLMNLYMH